MKPIQSVNKNKKVEIDLIKSPSKVKTLHTNLEIEKEISAKNEIRVELGIQSFSDPSNLSAPDGTFKPNLRATILDAILETKFDSVPHVIGNYDITETEIKDESLLSTSNYKTHSMSLKRAASTSRVNRLARPMVSVMRLDETIPLKKEYKVLDSNREIKSYEDLTINDVRHTGFDYKEDSIKSDLANISLQAKNMCFACWSSGSRNRCTLHSNDNDNDGALHSTKASESILLCRNWDLEILQRRYRSEEIQEIFMKKTASLKYDNKRKRFTSIEEYRHYIYRISRHFINRSNASASLSSKVKNWMLSLVDELRRPSLYDSIDETVNVSEYECSKVFHFNKEKLRLFSKFINQNRANLNSRRISSLFQRIKNQIPLPPTTGYSYNERCGIEKYLFTCIDNAFGKEVDLIMISPIPSSQTLYEPRVYPAVPKKTIPMMSAEYSSNATIGSKIFNSEVDALLQVDEYYRQIDIFTLWKMKQSAPSTTKLATLGRKSTINMLGVGGLPAELLVFQVLTKYFPPQYGNFVLMDKTIVSPGVSLEIMLKFESLVVPPKNQIYIFRPVNHPLNYRKPPTIGINSKISNLEKYFYGLNRPYQTGEEESHGFRTSTWSKELLIYDELDAQTYCPSVEVATLNFPGANHSNTTHADLTYPFCEPSTRDNTTLDFYYLLLSEVFSYSKPQIFTCLSIQEAGRFLSHANANLRQGNFIVSIYRSWAFVQKNVIEEFKSDEGISYWYHRRTGQTFWERPLYIDEEQSPLLGGTILDMNHNEIPIVNKTGSDIMNSFRYNQGDIRKTIVSHHESYNEAMRRRIDASHTAVVARERGVFTEQQKEMAIAVVSEKSLLLSKAKTNKLDHSEETTQIELARQNTGMNNLEKAKNIFIHEQQTNVVSETPDISTAPQLTMKLPANEDERLKEKIPVLLYPELSTYLPTGPPKEIRQHEAATTKLAKEADLVNANVKHYVTVPIPKDFYGQIIAPHVAIQEVDYLPLVPNLPQTRIVGRVKPRSSALDWIAISFDPWSAGKSPVNTELVTSLSANAEKFFEGGVGNSVDAIDMLRNKTVADAFTSLDDTEGLQEQRAILSRAQVLAQDFKKICSLCRHNKYTEVDQLINQPDWSLPIDYQDEMGNTLLHVASQNGNKRMIKIFMRRGISLDIQNLQGQTALHYLYGYGYNEVGDYLVKKGANDSIKNKFGLTCYEGLEGNSIA